MPLQPPPAQEYARFVFICMVLFFFYTSPDQGQNGFGSPRDYAAERINRSRHGLDVLNRTQWQDFSPAGPDKSRYEAAKWLNLTGFREADGYAWDRLEAFKKRSAVFSTGAWPLGHEQHPEKGLGNRAADEIYQNVTGIVVGQWVRYTGDLAGEERHRSLNLSEIARDINWAFRKEEFWTRNITGSEGRLKLQVEEKGVKEIDPGEAQHPLIVDQIKSPIREVSATMVVQDESSSGDGWEMKVHGVHWPKQGVLLMTTTSDKFAGIFGLPHLTTGQDQFLSSQELLNMTLETTIEKMEKAVWIDPSNPWTASPDMQGDSVMPTPHCEYVVYVQVYPLENGMPLKGKLMGDHATIVSQIEQDLRFPNGAPLPEIPPLQMSTVIFSPDCGFMLESKGPPDFSPADGVHLVGKKDEVYLHDAHNWVLVLALVMTGQIFLLKIQSKEASTPSTVGRVSLYTIAMMLMADAILFSSLSLLSATAPKIFPSALLASFAALMSVALGVRFIGAVYNVQEPERRERARVQDAAQAARTPARPAAAPTTTAPVITAAGADTAPLLPTTNPRPIDTYNTPIIIPSDQDIDAEIADNINAAAAPILIPSSIAAPLLPTTNPATTPQPLPRSGSSFGAVYVQFVITITLIMFLSLAATTWPVPIRSAYTQIMAMLYLSFWWPQIRRNVIRNCRKALLWKFIIGESILRLLPWAYFYLKPDNVLYAQPDWTGFAVLVGWVWIQIWILVAQEILGPRWGLPKTWTEEGWDYHPILKEDNVEAGGLPIGLVQIPSSPTLERARTSEDLGSGKKSDGGKRSVDCAICMQTLEVSVIASGSDAAGGGVVGMLARRQYMVTPCRHIFHSPCLEGWMRFRLQCPICREPLPPL